MRWDVLPASSEAPLQLARALVDITPRRGWGARAMQEASEAACADRHAWRIWFPRAARDAIWFISDVSDASMASAFKASPAPDLRAVIVERLAQNSDLKPFVRRVMLFDLLHPVQAVARMDRTARVMLACLAPHGRRPPASLLNFAYTLVVFIWLFDGSAGDARSYQAAGGLMRLIGG